MLCPKKLLKSICYPYIPVSGIVLDALTTQGSKYKSIVPILENSMVENTNTVESLASQGVLSLIRVASYH